MTTWGGLMDAAGTPGGGGAIVVTEVDDTVFDTIVALDMYCSLGTSTVARLVGVKDCCCCCPFNDTCCRTTGNGCCCRCCCCC